MSPMRLRSKRNIQVLNAKSKTRPHTRAYERQLALSSPGSEAPEDEPLTASRLTHSNESTSKLKKQQVKGVKANENDNPTRSSSKAKTSRPRSKNTRASNDLPNSQSKRAPKPQTTEPARASQSGLRRSSRVAGAQHSGQEPAAGAVDTQLSPQKLPQAKSGRKGQQKSAITDESGEHKSRSKNQSRDIHKVSGSRAQPRKPAKRPLTVPPRKPNTVQTTSPRTHIQGPVDAEPGNTLTDWLSHLPTDGPPSSPQVPPDSSFQMPPQTRDMNDRGESSSSVTNESKSSSVAPNDTKSNRTGTTAKGKPKTSDNVRLRQHFIETKSSEDPQLASFGIATLLNAPVRRLNLQAYKSFIELYEETGNALRQLISEDAEADTFLETDAYALFDLSLQNLYEWRPPGSSFRTWPGVTESQFRLDQSHCLDTNEANFQRTSMMSIVDRHDFQGRFAFSCEETWSTGDQRMPAIMENVSKIPAPRPDLMICFTGEAIEPDDLLRTMIPDWLGPYFYPVSGRDFSKMFPFFFIEVKKGDSSLKGGFERNLNSASQALYNIYQLMRHYRDLEQIFFDEVRVFTLDANVSDMNLRIHRAERHPMRSKVLIYKFFEFKALKAYGRVNACHSIKTVLLKYGLDRLLPIFCKVFKRVSADPPAELSPATTIHGEKRKQPAEENENIAQDDEAEVNISQSTTDGGSLTPRNPRSPTQLTGSFNSARFGISNEIASQPSAKRTKPADKDRHHYPKP